MCIDSMRLINCVDLHQTEWRRSLHHFLSDPLVCYTFLPFRVLGRGKNELLSHILCPAGRAELSAYQGARFFFGSVVGSYLRAERSFVCVQQLVRGFLFPLQEACIFAIFHAFSKGHSLGARSQKQQVHYPCQKNNLINVPKYSLHGCHLIAFLFWNYSSQQTCLGKPCSKSPSASLAMRNLFYSGP